MPFTPFGRIAPKEIKMSSAFNDNFVKCDSTGLMLPRTIAEVKTDIGIPSQGIQPLNTNLTAISAVTGQTTYGQSILSRTNKFTELRDLHTRDIQYATSKPTTRSDGTALAVNDHWFDTSANSWWNVYDGARWLTHQIYEAHHIQAATSVTSTTRWGISLRIPTATFNVAILSMDSFVARNSPVDAATNFWTATLDRLTSAQAVTTVATANFNTVLASGVDCVSVSTVINSLLTTASAIALWRISWNKTGTPGSLSQGSIVVRYRLAYV
jgi:hypothetical protein